MQRLFGPSRKNPNGSPLVEELHDLHSLVGLDLQMDGGTDHYLVDQRGDLEVRASDGDIVLSPRKLK